MKKTIKSFIAVAATVAALVSCAKEVSNPAGENGEKLIKLTIVANNPEAQPATRTEMNGSTPYWSVGDVIGVSNGTSTNYPFTTSITTAATTASFTGETEVSSTMYAYYPYQDNGNGSVGTANGTTGAKFDLPVEQAPTVTSFDGAADVMVAKSFTVTEATTTVEDLEFARLGAIVKIVLKDIGGIMDNQHPGSVSMTAASPLAGRFIIDMQNQCLSSIYYNSSNTVTAKYTSQTQYLIDNSNGTYLIVYPQTLASGTTLTIAAATEDYTISKTITLSKDIVLLPGKVNTLNISLAADNISSNASATPYELSNGDLTEGDYVIVYSGKAMKASVTSDRFDVSEVTISDNKIFDPSADIVWHIAPSEDYWTIYNKSVKAYAASTGAKNKAQLLGDGTDDMSLWTASGSSAYEFVNKKNAANNVNANLRYNSGYGFACYSTSTGGALSLYKLSDGKTDAGICYDSASATITYGQTFTQPSITNPHGLSVSYESSDTEVATVDADGTITVVGAGTAIITCSWNEQTIEGVKYRAGSDTFTLTVNKIAVSVAFNEPTTKVAVGATVTNVATTSPSGLTLQYNSSATDVATVASDGTVTGVKKGVAVITATYAGDETHETASDTYTITVGSANDGSLEHPYTVEDVRDLMDANVMDACYVTGTISSIVYPYSASYGTGTFFISDDGATTSDQFEAYSVKFFGNNAWVNGNTQIAVGNEVVIYAGELTIYTKDGVSTYETKSGSGSYLYSLNGITSEVVPIITKTDISDVSADGVTNATTTVSFANNDGWTPSVIPDGSVVTAASISGNTITYTVAKNTGVARTGSITVTLSKAGRTDALATISVEQKAAEGVSGGTATFTFGDNITATSGTINGVTLTTAKNNGSTAPAYNSNSEELRIYRYGSLTLSCSTEISNIVITYSGSSYLGSGTAANVGTYSASGAIGTWAGAANSVTITNTGTENVQMRIKSIVVTYK